MMLLYQTALEGIRKPDTITEGYINCKMEVLLQQPAEDECRQNAAAVAWNQAATE